jgi:hypothetical protein
MHSWRNVCERDNLYRYATFMFHSFTNIQTVNDRYTDVITYSSNKEYLISGYVNYIGMIMVDVAHNHPIMRVFCFLVKNAVENRRDVKPLRSAAENAIYCNLTIQDHIPSQTGMVLEINAINTLISCRFWC